MQTWYNLRNDAGKTPVLSIFDDIGAYGVSAKDFINTMRTVDADTVTVEINSPGGDFFAAIAIHNALRASGKTVNVKVLGLAASAASLIAMAGDTIEMPENTFMMVHKTLTHMAANAADMRETAELLDKFDAGLVTLYAKRTGKPTDEISAILDAETWMTAQEAVDAGFATSVTPAFAVRASYGEDRLPERVLAAFKAHTPDDTPPVEATQTPEGTESPEAVEATAPVFGATLASHVVAISNAAGLGQYAALWGADPALRTVAQLEERAALAREVQALCVLAKFPDKADKFIKAATPLPDVRAAIFAALEQDYEHVDTSAPAAKAQNTSVQATAVKGADIWAARRNKTAK